MKYREISTRGFAGFVEESADCGVEPELRWINISDLVIDPEYQRDLLRRGQLNVVRIAREFDWSKFSTVIVAAIGDGRFAIVDGQHRTTAAALRGLKRVPCQVIVADRNKQADAFASINAAVTSVSSLQVHAAKVVAGDKRAVALTKACAAAGVSICRYPVPADKMKAGDTLAASSLYRYLERFGTKTLTLALKCIVKTGRGNVGMVRAQIVAALCIVLDAEPKWAADERTLLSALDSFDFRGALRRARMGEQNIQTAVVASITGHLSRAMKRAA